MSWVPIVQSANCPGAKCPKRQMSGAKCPGAGWRAPFVSLPSRAFSKIPCDWIIKLLHSQIVFQCLGFDGLLGIQQPLWHTAFLQFLGPISAQRSTLWRGCNQWHQLCWDKERKEHSPQLELDKSLSASPENTHFHYLKILSVSLEAYFNSNLPLKW